MSLTNFSEVRFPTDVSLGSTFGPEFATDIPPGGGGNDVREQVWQQARMRGEIRYTVKTILQLQTVLAFVLARRGKAQGFRFKHHLDYQAVTQTCAMVGQLRTEWQLYSRYTSGGVDFLRTIRKPVGLDFPMGQGLDTITIYQDAGLLDHSAYVLDYTTGRFTLFGDPGPTAQFTWSGEFDVPVRFDTDACLQSLLLPRVGHTEPLPIIELLSAD